MGCMEVLEFKIMLVIGGRLSSSWLDGGHRPSSPRLALEIEHPVPWLNRPLAAEDKQLAQWHDLVP
jgi:hypothetical protein